MLLDWNSIRDRGIAGVGITEEEARAIGQLTDPDTIERMLEVAEEIKRHHKGNEIYTCGITNAKSGRCPEKCSFCSQSAFYNTEAPAYPLKPADLIAAEARAAEAHGVREFSIVTSGRSLSDENEINSIKDSLRQIRETSGVQTCASLGLMTKDQLADLQEAGLDSYHHNLETSRSFHPNVVETHSYDEERESIVAAKSLGLYVCCGGIFGMGETWDQRVELAVDLRALNVDSVPINFLNPRPGTPLADKHDLTPETCLKIIAMLRLMLPERDLIVCGGREVNLEDRQPELFRAGANGVMLGNYLTTQGTQTDRDLQMIDSLGLEVRPPPHTPTAPLATS